MTSDLSGSPYLVVLEHSELDLLPLVLVLLGGGVGLLLPLLGTTAQPQNQVQRRLLRTNRSQSELHRKLQTGHFNVKALSQTLHLILFYYET